MEKSYGVKRNWMFQSGFPTDGRLHIQSHEVPETCSDVTGTVSIQYPGYIQCWYGPYTNKTMVILGMTKCPVV
jgi:hypothetical protein